MVRASAALAVLLAALAIAACGGEEPELTGRGEAAPPTGGGTLDYALGRRPRQLDPLLARDRASLTVTSQIHEPLVARLRGPFGDQRRVRGLALRWRSAGGGTIWSFRLRRRVRFQDGTPFNAGAVVANVDRWLGTGAGPTILPELEAADAPEPDRVRLILSQPAEDLPDRLRDPRLGIVSPAALAGGGGLRLGDADASGSGAFELRELSSQRTVIARNDRWWGTREELGPGLDQIEFTVLRSEEQRLDALRAGAVRVADELGEDSIERLRGDPLLTALKGPDGEVLGLERSVRGINSTDAGEPLSGAWLTLIETS